MIILINQFQFLIKSDVKRHIAYYFETTATLSFEKFKFAGIP